MILDRIEPCHLNFCELRPGGMLLAKPTPVIVLDLLTHRQQRLLRVNGMAHQRDQIDQTLKLAESDAQNTGPNVPVPIS